MNSPWLSVFKDKKHSAAYLDWTQRWLTEVQHVLKPDGTFWLAIGDEYAAEIKLIAPSAAEPQPVVIPVDGPLGQSARSRGRVLAGPNL